MTDDIPVTPMPKIVQEEYIQEHTYASEARDAHPIDQDILQDVCDSKMGPILIDFDLALIQAVAIREVLPYDCETETWIEQDGDMHYYQAQSVSFYDLLSMAYQRYDSARVEIEDAADLAEAHTRQYLRDVHGYEGDFGGTKATGGPWEPTLCNAQNDDHSLRDAEPEDAHYAFTDARGLVIQAGTHPEDNET